MFGFGRSSSDKTKTTSTRRREELRRNLPRPTSELVQWATKPECVAALVITIIAGLALGTVVALSRHYERAYPGQLAIESRINPREYAVEDKKATAEARENARRAAPRFYVANAAYLSALRAAIEGLPVATFEKSDLASIDPELVSRFGLSQESLKELQRYGGPKTASNEWREWSDRFVGLLWSEEPIIASQEYQVFATTLKRRVLPPEADQKSDAPKPPAPTSTIEPAARDVDLAHELPPGDAPVDVSFKRAIAGLARDAGFPEALVPVATAAVVSDPRPTVFFDETRTARAADDASAKVSPSMERHPAGEVIYARGDVLTPSTIERLGQSLANERVTRPFRETAARISGSLAFGVAIAVLVLLYCVRHEPRIGRRPPRLTGIFVLMLVPGSIAAITSGSFPIVTLPVAAAATLFVAGVTALAYGQRLALFLAATQSLFLTIATNSSEVSCLVIFLGAATLVSMLKEVRHRAVLVRASGVTAIVLALSFVVLGAFDTQLAPSAWPQTLRDALLAAIGAYAIGFLILGVLPTLERAFGVTTGLTLAELRDPRHPLLRQMQERAPGTYSHSLQVANIAEAAAEAIGADGLLTYAGALYHDIGKINKPEYFVENQLGAPNRHERLSPAMSLLVIVGHVKDGLELAKEYVLPKPLHHFIEAHHGTTLVEYFFHRAKTEAEKKGDDVVEEFDFRYPGPKPRTKEAAILMLADASESATRALAEPTHGRIDSLVRSIARKRLDDGQFDECPLTFGDLRAVEDSLIKSLAAVHHGRIAYPTTTITTSALGQGGSAKGA